MFTKIATALVLCAAISGCVVAEDHTPPSSSYGTLTALWTLDGADDSLVCADYAVDRVDVAVFDDDGFTAVTAQPYCEDFGVSFDLGAAWYTTEITLLDYDGYAVSDTVIVDARVVRDTEVLVDVDFPNSTIF